MNDLFRKFSARTSEVVGSPAAFGVSLLIVLLWIITGPTFDFSDTWQLVINTGTTIVTFLMVFLIQNTQNRDAKAIHLKLDELIRSDKRARNSMIEIELLSDRELLRLEQEFALLRAKDTELHNSLTVVEQLIDKHHGHHRKNNRHKA